MTDPTQDYQYIADASYDMPVEWNDADYLDQPVPLLDQQQPPPVLPIQAAPVGAQQKDNVTVPPPQNWGTEIAPPPVTNVAYFKVLLVSNVGM